MNSKIQIIGRPPFALSIGDKSMSDRFVELSSLRPNPLKYLLPSQTYDATITFETLNLGRGIIISVPISFIVDGIKFVKVT